MKFPISLFILAFFSLLDAETLLLSNMRSGTYYHNFLTTYFFQQPVKHPGHKHFDNVLNLPLNNSIETLIRNHDPVPNMSHLILLIRNYKENIVNNHLNDNLSSKQLIDIFKQYHIQVRLHGRPIPCVSYKVNVPKPTIKRYFENLIFYDSFQGAKMIVYYEDLLNDPIKEMERFAHFMGYDVNCISEEKIRELPSVTKRNMDWYYENFPERKQRASKGRGVDFYSKQYPKMIRKRIDYYVAHTFPKLFAKYLRRYKEN